MTEAQTKQCQSCKARFVIEDEDFAFYEKIKVPPPTFCPECRYQRRAANRNEWSFYKRSCSLCGQEMVSLYNPDYPGPVYCSSCWRSDRWDPLSYGRDFDFSRPFFEQFQELRLRVPHVALAQWNSVNSEYTNQSLDNKNCYLCVASSYNEDCLYGQWFQKSRESMDCLGVEQCELAYECSNCTNCNRVAYLEGCNDCSSSYFLLDCRGCSSCFGCVGLRGKSYCWFNVQLSKQEYADRIAQFLWTREAIADARQKLRELALRRPYKHYHGSNAVGSKGDYLVEVKAAINAFNAYHAEDVRHCQDAGWSKDSMDCTEVFSELGYELEGVEARNSIAVAKSVASFDAFYSELISSSGHIFGCVSLHQKEYCILNKPYSKEEYYPLQEKIIAHMRKTGEWGEFFPARHSLFAYNETIAQDYFPLSEAEAVARGYRWYHPADRRYGATIAVGDIPKRITETDDSILKETIRCVSQATEQGRSHYLRCTTAFRITERELELYRKMVIPVPERCYACRRQGRMEARNPRRLWQRKCTCAGVGSENEIYANTAQHPHADKSCPEEFETSYAPERPEIVYCESCYNAEVA